MPPALKKLRVFPILTLATLLLGLGSAAYAAFGKAPSQKNAPAATQKVLPRMEVYWGGQEEDAVSPGERPQFEPSVSSSVSPFITLHFGIREADNNGVWPRHAVRKGDVIHTLYPVFDNDPVTNNRHKYNCAFRCDSLQFAPGTEPQANPPQSDHNGALDVIDGTGQGVWVGRGVGANTGTIFNRDASSCLGLISTVVVSTAANRPLDPDVYVANETTIVAFMSAFNGADVLASTSFDTGNSWTTPTPVTVASFLRGIPTGKGSTIYYFTPVCQPVGDSGAFDGTEHIMVVKSTNNGLTWTNPPVDVSGNFELTTYFPLPNGGTSAIMVGDTPHVAWLDWNQDNPAAPVGGHVHHAAIDPVTLSRIGPIQKVADINIIADNPDISDLGFALGFGIWQHPSLSYDPSRKLMYCLWSSPPEGGPGGISGELTAPVGAALRQYPVADIWCAVSRNHGRTWGAKTNVTQTNHPGCDFNTVQCEHEFYISAAEKIGPDTTIYVIAQVQKFPGFQSLGATEPAPPPPYTTVAERLAGEWRLYCIPARRPVVIASCSLTTATNLSNLHLLPGGPPTTISVTVKNSGLADLFLESVEYTGNLNGTQLITNDNAVPSTPIPELGSYTFNVTFDPSQVTSHQSGLRTGQIRVIVATNDPEAVNTKDTCELSATVYVVPNFCLNSGALIHSASNQTDIFSQGAVTNQGANGMFYPASIDGDNFIFDGGVAIVNPVAANGPKGLRHYYADQFLRCLTGLALDSVSDGNGFYNMSVKSLATGLLDSSIIYETIFEQSTDPAYSDLLAMTVQAVNISGSDIADVILGTAFDVDVFSAISPPFSGPKNLSYDTSFTASFDGKIYTMLVLSGIEPDTGFGFPPRHCTPNDKYFGAITIPNDTASPSPVTPRGAVAFNNLFFTSYISWRDSQFVNRLDVVGYHTARNLADTNLTGMGVIYAFDSCSNGGSSDIGFVIGAKKVTLPYNPILANLSSRFGLEAIAAGLDTLTLQGPSESYTVLFVAGIAGLNLFMESCDSAVSWYNRFSLYQAGGDIALAHRGDLNSDRVLTAADVVMELNGVFLGQPALAPVCTFDLNLDGDLTAVDVVMELNYAFLGTKPTPDYPDLPELMACFNR